MKWASFLVLGAISCGYPNAKWDHDITIVLPRTTDDEVIAAYFDCIDLVDPHFPYDMSLQLGGKGDITVSTVTKKEWRKLFDNDLGSSTKPQVGPNNAIQSATTLVQERFFNKDHHQLFCHEVLHALGLFEHSQNKKDVMYEGYFPGQTYDEALGRIVSLYYKPKYIL